MKIQSILLYISILVFFFSCKFRDEILKGPDVKLRFTADTVLFDTVFTRVGSVTKRFLVHNDYNKSIKISSIKLGGGKSSSYRLNIDGEATNQVTDYTLLPHDSFYIFVDVTINPNDVTQPFIIKDSILFETNGNLQDVKLIAWGQDAHYLKDSVIDYDKSWTNDKPYVIYNSALLTAGHTLTILPGVKVYFYGMVYNKVSQSNSKSTLYIQGTLKINGTVDEPVKMLGVRKEEYYRDLPGQWGGIRILPKSSNNSFKNLQIRNADVGIEVDSASINPPVPNLVIENVMIENMSSACMISYTSHIQAFNCLFDNSCQYLVAADLGGKLEFYQCTLGNSSCQCTSSHPALSCYNTNYRDSVNHINIKNDLYLILYNSIIWGDMGSQRKDELELKNTGDGNMFIDIQHSLLKTSKDTFNINSNILNKDPLFVSPCKYSYKLDTLSPAINAGMILSFPQTGYDILGKPRTGIPDLGVYERQ